jgi:hypothetical protein
MIFLAMARLEASPIKGMQLVLGMELRLELNIHWNLGNKLMEARGVGYPRITNIGQ